MAIIFTNVILAMTLGHAAEVADTLAGFKPGPPGSIIGFSADVPVKRVMPVTFLSGLYGKVPQGTCETTAKRNADGSVSLSLAARPHAGKGFSGLSHELTVRASEYPLKPGFRRESIDGSGAKTVMTYDGFTLKISTTTADAVNRYEYAVDATLVRISRVSVTSFGDAKAEPSAETLSLECQSPVG